MTDVSEPAFRPIVRVASSVWLARRRSALGKICCPPTVLRLIKPSLTLLTFGIPRVGRCNTLGKPLDLPYSRFMTKRALAPRNTSQLPDGGTRDQALIAARRLIQTRSYLGFSFQDVADAVGVRKPSLYYHFPSKEALGAQVLGEAIEAFRRWAQSVAALAPEDRLNAYFRMYRNDIRAGERVCPGGSFVAGWDCIEDELRGGVRAIRAEQVLWLTGVLGALLAPGKPASVMASYVYAGCQGALLTSRMTGLVEQFDEVIAQLKQSILS